MVVKPLPHFRLTMLSVKNQRFFTFYFSSIASLTCDVHGMNMIECTQKRAWLYGHALLFVVYIVGGRDFAHHIYPVLEISL